MVSLMVLLKEKQIINEVDHMTDNMKFDSSAEKINHLFKQLFHLFKRSVQPSSKLGIDNNHPENDQTSHWTNQKEISPQKLYDNLNLLISDTKNKNLLALLQVTREVERSRKKT
jgi:hypothetical protein